MVQAKAGEGAGNGLGKHEQRYCSIRHVRGWQETKALKTDLRKTEPLAATFSFRRDSGCSKHSRNCSWERRATMATPESPQPGIKNYLVVEGLSRASIETRLNEFAADGYRCINFTAMRGTRGKTQFIAVMERSVG